ncbi:MAG: DegV family protein [Solirubrobacterales bacterium]
MEKIAVVTDTTCDLPEEITSKYDIKVLPFRIIYTGSEYRDKVEITPEQVYENLLVEVPTSSMPAMEDMEELYTNLEKEGYTHVIAVVLSTGLSGVYNGIKVVSENHPNITTHVCDSQSISLGEGALAEECGKLVQQGKSYDYIVNEIPNIKKRIHLFFVVGTLEYLKKGGRIGKVSGSIAELLNIKPIISVDRNDGKYYTYDKVRGRKQSLNRIVEIGSEILNNKKSRVYVMHGESKPDALKVLELLSRHPNATEAVFVGSISPVAGVHTGPGLVGLVLVEEE